MMNTLPHAVLIVTCSSVLAINAGCNDATSEPPESVAQTVEESRPAFDLEATMNELAATLELRATLSRQAAEDPESVDRALADRISDTFYNEQVLILLIKTQMVEEPTWVPSICEWYDAVIRTPNEKQIRVFKSTFQQGSTFGTAVAARIYGEDYSDLEEYNGKLGFEMFSRGSDRFKAEHPNPRFKKFQTTGDLYVFCVNMRMIEK